MDHGRRVPSIFIAVERLKTENTDLEDISAYHHIFTHSYSFLFSGSIFESSRVYPLLGTHTRGQFHELAWHILVSNLFVALRRLRFQPTFFEVMVFATERMETCIVFSCNPSSEAIWPLAARFSRKFNSSCSQFLKQISNREAPHPEPQTLHWWNVAIKNIGSFRHGKVAKSLVFKGSLAGRESILKNPSQELPVYTTNGCLCPVQSHSDHHFWRLSWTRGMQDVLGI